MHIYAAEEATKWLFQGAFPFELQMDSKFRFEVTLHSQEAATSLLNHLMSKGHTVEVFGGLHWRVF